MFGSVAKALRSKTDGRDAWSFTRSLRNAVLFLPGLITGQSSRAIKAKKKRFGKQSAPTHPHPTIELFDVRQIEALAANDIAGVAVVMPCINAKVAMDTARLLASRAGMDCRIIVVNDTLRQGFIKTLNDTAARMSVRYVVYLAQDAYPGRNWLRDAHDALERSGKGLLGFNDGTYKGRIATFGMVRTDWVRSFYGGPILHPGYKCHGADNELTVIARALDSYVYEPNCTLVEYDPDKESKPGHKLDAKLFRQRFVTGFDGLVPIARLQVLAPEYKVNAASIAHSPSNTPETQAVKRR